MMSATVKTTGPEKKPNDRSLPLMTEEQVVLVTPLDEELGVMEKMEAHRQGRLHRAFSIFLFDTHGKMLLQRRSEQKYHFPGLWTNACCSHPKPGEALLAGAARRLTEELGISVPLQLRGNVIYRFYDPVSGLTEHELDYVLTGCTDGPLHPDPLQISELRWLSLEELKQEIECYPGRFTPWFRHIMKVFPVWNG
ncbi:MAG: isopentenyl-diphosphate Delta-isomerase [Chitinophagales bacterium]|nr:isopentenyl-diphosphate Delta-isomerase [Chitinophagales bacterium]MDW8393446.1 isopentenyl-diphosphate Delta-isomerase [Chitinophagales bacterium]